MNRPLRCFERFIEIQGRTVRLLDVGEGEPVVLLHGLGGWAEMWRDVANRLLRDQRYRLLIPDLPGFGESEPPPAVRYFDLRNPFYVGFLDQLLERCGVPTTTLIGHSLGGTISALYAVKRPRRVHRMALIAPGGFERELGLVFRLGTLPLWQRFSRSCPSALVRLYLRANAARGAKLPDWFVEQACYYAKRGGTDEMYRVLAQAVTIWGTRDELRNAWCARFARLRCPTLILWGQEDRTIPCPRDRTVSRLCPQAELKRIPQCGHLSIVEKAAEIGEALATFLAQEAEGRGLLAASGSPLP